MFENSTEHEIVTLNPVEDEYDPYESNLGRNQQADDTTSKSNYHLTNL